MSRPSVRLELEVLEDRTAPAVFTVTSGKDSGDGTLSAAISAVNAGKYDTIHFNIADQDGAQVVKLTSPLPAILRPVTIDGSTAPGQRVKIDGSQILTGLGQNPPDGLVFMSNAYGNASGSQVLGLEIDQFGGDGILLSGVSNVLMGARRDPSTNRLYFDPAAMAIDGNGNAAIEISGASSTKNTVFDSLVGLNHDLPKKNNYGILLDNGANNNTIGGLTSSEANVISGNGNTGVEIQGANNNTVSGNEIGTDISGTESLPNGGGVTIEGNSTGNKIGTPIAPVRGVSPRPANLISGNTNWGVKITGQTATGNFVQGNWIGIDATGKTPLPNSNHGVVLSNTKGNLVGGVAEETMNVISGNSINGVSVDTNATNDKIENNNIGIGPDRGM